MRRRPSARILVLDQEGRVLLFRFTFKDGALEGQEYWATPGGELEPDESFEEAAQRELFEETGLTCEVTGPHVAEQEFELELSDGEKVWAMERFFAVRVTAPTLSRDHWTPEEQEVMTAHRWWSVEELNQTRETCYPKMLVNILSTLLV